MPRQQTESQIQRDILAAFGSRDDLLLWRESVGVGLTPDASRVIKFGTPGAADIGGVWRREWGGHAIGIEVKTPTGRQSPKQRTWQSAFERVGGIYILARSVDDVAKILGAPARSQGCGNQRAAR